MKKEFNLLYEPWICVREKGEKKEVSLLDLFEHDYDGFDNDHEVQTVAILRQLMAIMYTVMERNGISWKIPCRIKAKILYFRCLKRRISSDPA